MNLRKFIRKAAIILALTMVIGAVCPAGIIKADGMPELLLTANVYGDAERGGTVTINVDVRNRGNGTAKNVELSLSDNALEHGVSLVSASKSKFDVYANGLVSVTLTVDILPTAAIGTTTIGVGASYSDGFSAATEISLDINEASDPSQLVTKYLSLGNNASNVIKGVAGEKIHVSLPIKALASGVTISEFELSGVPSEAMVTTTNRKFTKDGVDRNSIELKQDDTGVYAEFDLAFGDIAKIGIYDAVLKIKCTTSTGSVNAEIPVVVRVTGEKAPAQLVVANAEYQENQVYPGNTFDLKLTLKNEGELSAVNTYFNIGYDTSIMAPNYSVETKKLGEMAPGTSKEITVSIKVLDNAPAGIQIVPINFTYTDDAGSSSLSATRNIYITIKEGKNTVVGNPQLIISNADYNTNIKAGETAEISIRLDNTGKADASSIKVSVSEGIGVSTGIIPVRGYESTSIEKIATGGFRVITLPIEITKQASNGLTELTIKAEYYGTDKKAEPYTATTRIYFMVENPEKEPEKEEKNIYELSFDDIKQSPAAPVVGNGVTVSFTVKNTGNTAMKDIKLKCDNLSSAGFEPVSQDPYYDIGTLEPEETRNVTIYLKVGTGIGEGTNTLNLSYTYNDKNEEQLSGSTMFYILNVQNDSSSKPKLIISDYSVDTEEIKAGSEFVFNFEIKNTHISKPAKNIKVTVIQDNDVFSPAEGGNSFYIDRIDAGTVYDGSMLMKVKNDTTTGSYELRFEIEYEYENMSTVDMENGGVKETSTVKLQAVENARPVVQNMNMYDYNNGTVTVNSSATLSFEFVNMGKSTLNNVFFTLDGDFSIETGTMYWQGTASAGSYEYIEISVIPAMEGMCTGKIVVHFEDSNGEEVTKEFELDPVYVQAQQSINWGDDPYNPDDPYVPADNNDVKEAKELLPLWAFIAVQAGVLIIVIPVTRAIRIAFYKRKLRREEEKED